MQETKKRGNPRKPNQKAFSLKVDNDLLEYLKEKKPVNRFINQLIRDSKNNQIETNLQKIQTLAD